MSGRRGLKPLNSSTNLINSNDLLSGKASNLKRNSLASTTNEKSEPKVSLTEQYDGSKSQLPSKTETGSLQKAGSSKKLVSSTNRDKSIKKKSAYPNAELRKAKKRAIKTVLSKDQRVKKWLTSKEPVQDVEYWRLSSERLGKELTETLDKLDDLESENELLVAEYEYWSKLAEGAYKLNKLLAKIDLPEPSIDTEPSTSKKNDSLTDHSIDQTSDDDE